MFSSPPFSARAPTGRGFPRRDAGSAASPWPACPKGLEPLAWILSRRKKTNARSKPPAEAPAPEPPRPAPDHLTASEIPLAIRVGLGNDRGLFGGFPRAFK